MTKSEEILAKYESFINPGLARLLRFMGLSAVEREADGSVVTDWEGKPMIDCVGGYGTFTLGHRHPRVIAAVEEQLKKMPLSSKVMLSEPMAELAEKLARITPGDLTYTFVCNSGTEAVEGAIKLARIATGRTRIISMLNSFHGKTMGSLSASGKDLYRAPFQPLLPGFAHVPFGDPDLLENAMDEDTAAVILEPIQGEAGIIVPPPGYLKRVRELCDRKGILLIADEVQTGMGRTGMMFACEEERVVPDIMCLAKALGGGVMPIGAFVARPHLYVRYNDAPLLHTSTFGGNPLACAAANAAIDVLLEEKLYEEAAVKGNYLISRLSMLAEEYPGTIAEVRGKGLMIGVEFANEAVGGIAMSELIENGVLTAFALNNLRVTRIEPPLNIEKHQIEQVLETFRKALEGGCSYAVS
jgi:putrescine aminotransferase